MLTFNPKYYYIDGDNVEEIRLPNRYLFETEQEAYDHIRQCKFERINELERELKN